ncbi:MAG TPA: hypothetical protein VJ754_05860 [Anaerolineae bacterium]|nr:hypothetical protein [Anaerolineae bacterium]
MKHHPFISLPGCLSALLFIAGMLGVTVAAGGVMFSPGLLSAQGEDRSPLKGYTSHVDFEGRCEWCHAPWTGVTASLCEDCHTRVADERRASTGVHGVLGSTHDCRLCHVEHEGGAADQSAAAMKTFPHEQTGYSLVKHQAWPDNRAFACRDCHDADAPGYRYDPALCETCHRRVEAAFVDQHIAQYSADCLACHQQLEPFDHRLFALRGGHAGVACADCHAESDFAGASAECVACHADPEIHAGMFGADCAVCHTVDGWLPARLEKHEFPIDHGGEGEIACATCHVQSYSAYTCYNCHEHDEREVTQKHIEEGMTDFADCMECHADGKTHKDERGDD